MSLRPTQRAVLASAAIGAALLLAGCDTDNVVPSGRANAPLSDKMLAELQAKHMVKESPILVRLFKEESELEVWKKNEDGEFALLKTYPICRWSGDLGPKVREGDRQAPEGFYTITPGQMNPNSNYYLAFNTGYPNTYDRVWGHTGSELMVHGDCSSRGCYAMTDEQMVEIYALARESFFGGQKSFQFQAYPFRMTARNMARHRDNPNLAFWKMLKVGYDHFEVTHQQPKVDVCEKRYVFDAAAPEGSTHALSFSPTGKCPVYEIPKEIAEAVKEREQQDGAEYAQLVASNLPVAPSHKGIDGGMNPVFLAQVSAPVADNDGRIQGSVVTQHTPGTLPREPNHPPAQVVPPVQVATADAEIPTAAPVATANVPVPRAAPLPKVGKAPGTVGLAGLFGNVFGGSTKEEGQSETAEAATPATQPTLAASTKTTLAKFAPVRPAQAEPAPTMRTAAAPAKPASIAQAATTSKSTSVGLRPQLKDEPQAQTAQPEPEIRSAYNAQPAPKAGLLAGAQPVVPAGSFENRWAAFR